VYVLSPVCIVFAFFFFNVINVSCSFFFQIYLLSIFEGILHLYHYLTDTIFMLQITLLQMDE
jgi:hypothetical protein